MKKLSQEFVKDEFASYACELLGEYSGFSVPVEYRCTCGVVGKISLDKFRQRVRRGECCKDCAGVWTKDEDYILRECYGRVGRLEILSRLNNKTYSSVKSRAIVLGLRGNRSKVMGIVRRGRGRRYSFDKDFFRVAGLVNGYWAGYLCGHHYRVDVRGSFFLRVSVGQEGVLRSFQDVICHTGLLQRVSSGRLMLVLHGVERWVEDLRLNYGDVSGLDEGKSLAFIAGLVDGQGCVGAVLKLYGSRDLLTWVKGWFDSWYPELNKKLRNLRCIEGLEWEYEICGARARFLMEKLGEGRRV